MIRRNIPKTVEVQNGALKTYSFNSRGQLFLIFLDKDDEGIELMMNLSAEETKGLRNFLNQIDGGYK